MTGQQAMEVHALWRLNGCPQDDEAIDAILAKFFAPPKPTQAEADAIQREVTEIFRAS